MTKRINIFFLIVLLLFLLSNLLLADDVGITKARLIQTSDTTYVFEADVPMPLLWTIEAPVFPDRFVVSGPEYIDQPGWTVVKYSVTSASHPLDEHDEIILPWARNGVDLTAKWTDDSMNKALLMRNIEGIKVPVRLIKTYELNLTELCYNHFRRGISHFPFLLIHMLFVLILCLTFSSLIVFRFILYSFIGHSCSLILAEFQVPGLSILYVDILGILIIVVLANYSFYKVKDGVYSLMIFCWAILFGLSYANEIAGLGLPPDQIIPAIFMFNLAHDLGYLILASLFLLLIPHIKKNLFRRVLRYVTGILGITALLIAYIDYVGAGKLHILGFEKEGISMPYELPLTSNTPSAGNKQAGAREMTSPVMCYISIEPYEVRQEILIQVRAGIQMLGIDDKEMEGIQVDSLEVVKNGILKLFSNSNTFYIDESLARPLLMQADFVTLSAAGVLMREKPVAESLDNGIIGVTLVYETPGLASSHRLQWQIFPEIVDRVEVTTIDRIGAASNTLTPEQDSIHWKSRFTGYEMPEIMDLKADAPEIPLISIFLLIITGIWLLVNRIWVRRFTPTPIMVILLIFSFTLYPFARSSTDIPWLTNRKPSPDRTAILLDDLLTNVYRAFDVRNESYVYDRLEKSVTGTQLNRIYLENVKSMEIEKRGGARANVDEVEIVNVDHITRADAEGFIAEAQWMVSGSVNHFGHTHYRRNSYQAKIHFVIVYGSWKIKDIELIDEKRIV